jgi:hypothetical protein
MRDDSYREFDDALNFNTSERIEGDYLHTTSSIVTLTLHRVPNGNVTTKDIRKDQFLRYKSKRKTSPD